MRNMQLGFLCAAGFLGWLGFTSPLFAGTIIDANSFTFVNNTGGGGAASDFHLQIGGKFVGDPSSSVFPNRSVNVGTANFSGNTLANGGSHNVKFKSNGFNPKPRGHFTCPDPADATKTVRCSATVRSKALDGTLVAFAPAGGGLNFTLQVFNDFGAQLTGMFEIVINRPGFSQFELDTFDTPVDEEVLLSGAFDLAAGEFLNVDPLVGHLASLDEFLLIRGTADALDGTGPLAFAIGISPAAVPEPGTALLFVAGLLVLISAARMGGRRSGRR